MISIRRCERPDLRPPEIICDGKLSPALDQYPLTATLNCHFACVIYGKAGSGKTSLLVSLLSKPNGVLYRVFHKVYVFMPSGSRASLKNDIFGDLPEDQLYDGLKLDDLLAVRDKIAANAKDDKLSLLVFDDVQQFFKGECEATLLGIINNRRHTRTCIFALAQTYKKVPRSVRLASSHVVLFRLSEDDMADVKKEVVPLTDAGWSALLDTYADLVKDARQKHFIFVAANDGRIFLDWDEVVESRKRRLSYDDT